MLNDRTNFDVESATIDATPYGVLTSGDTRLILPRFGSGDAYVSNAGPTGVYYRLSLLDLSKDGGRVVARFRDMSQPAGEDEYVVTIDQSGVSLGDQPLSPGRKPTSGQIQRWVLPARDRQTVFLGQTESQTQNGDLIVITMDTDDRSKRGGIRVYVEDQRTLVERHVATADSTFDRNGLGVSIKGKNNAFSIERDGGHLVLKEGRKEDVPVFALSLNGIDMEETTGRRPDYAFHPDRALGQSLDDSFGRVPRSASDSDTLSTP